MTKALLNVGLSLAATIVFFIAFLVGVMYTLQHPVGMFWTFVVLIGSLVFTAFWFLIHDYLYGN